MILITIIIILIKSICISNIYRSFITKLAFLLKVISHLKLIWNVSFLRY